MKRFGLRALSLLIVLALAGCGGLWKPSRSTTVNAPTFPQPEGAVLPQPKEPPTPLPPPVSENATFRLVGGAAQYRIGVGDVLDLTVMRGAAPDKIQATVRPDGKIFVLLTEIAVDGLTANEAASAVKRELATFFRNPQVEVQVKEFHSKKIRVFGAVGVATRASSSLLPLTGRTSLLEAIGKAGGFHANAEMEKVRVTRADGKAYTVNMYRFMQEGDAGLDFILDAGDTVFVPELVKGAEQRVYLIGEVKAPGPVPYIPRLTMGQLIAQVGGWTDGALYEEAAVIRARPDVTEILTVDLRQLLLEGNKRIDQYLLPNDIVFVPRTKIASWNAFISQILPTFNLANQPLSTVLQIKAIQDLND
ncbi:MAG: polysaccharide biosynthesis/export family protein [Candidatus Methylomirabilota bacterium]